MLLSICKAFNDVQTTTSRDLYKFSKWQAPPDEYLKVNVNGAVFADFRKARVGIVLRDMSGGIVMAASKNEEEVDEELHSTEESFASAGNLINEAKNLMRHFPEVQVQHVNRIGNGVAHSLARYAWNVVDINIWWDQIPSFVSHALWFDTN
ncbi:hypothetical protein F2P56_011350 [Juglans regia]|uniref:Uncharacterized protein LOC108998215 n=2 Tax=Juglans regia TaxID=51240 RepID=A0A2I4FF44_JUGRE|nr:uncharacterized protein LOC108998215 [Juglans regia]KAF5470862.1 hypothetical protein F2P56_011350 [Juglans regia]